MVLIGRGIDTSRGEGVMFLLLSGCDDFSVSIKVGIGMQSGSHPEVDRESRGHIDRDSVLARVAGTPGHGVVWGCHFQIRVSPFRVDLRNWSHVGAVMRGRDSLAIPDESVGCAFRLRLRRRAMKGCPAKEMAARMGPGAATRQMAMVIVISPACSG